MPAERGTKEVYPPGEDVGGLNQSGHTRDGKQSDELKRFFSPSFLSFFLFLTFYFFFAKVSRQTEGEGV